MINTFYQLMAGGVLSLILAVYARLADRKRLRRRKLDAVGFMPWETIFVLALLVAVVLLSFALKAWISN